MRNKPHWWILKLPLRVYPGKHWEIPRGKRWWLHYWTPAWHKGRGPYLSIGLGWFAIYRGY